MGCYKDAQTDFEKSADAVVKTTIDAYMQLVNGEPIPG